MMATTETLKTICPSCGVEHDLEIPSDTKQFGLKFGTTLAEKGVMCDPCGDRERAAEEAEKEKEVHAARLKSSGVPLNLCRYGWDAWPSSDPIIQAAKHWSVNGGIMVLEGDPGTGKTHLAGTALMGALFHRRVKWLSVAKLMSDLNKSWSDDDRAKALRTVTDDGALILDDLDKANASTDRVCEILFGAIDSRVAAGTPLLVTTNMDPRALGRKLGPDYGESIVSRLVGGTSYHVMNGPDRRLG